MSEAISGADALTGADDERLRPRGALLRRRRFGGDEEEGGFTMAPG